MRKRLLLLSVAGFLCACQAGAQGLTIEQARAIIKDFACPSSFTVKATGSLLILRDRKTGEPNLIRVPEDVPEKAYWDKDKDKPKVYDVSAADECTSYFFGAPMVLNEDNFYQTDACVYFALKDKLIDNASPAKLYIKKAEEDNAEGGLTFYVLDSSKEFHFEHFLENESASPNVRIRADFTYDKRGLLVHEVIENVDFDAKPKEHDIRMDVTYEYDVVS